MSARARPEVWKLTGICEHCGEATAFILTRQDIKALFKAMRQQTIEQAQKYMENYLKRRLPK